MADTPIMNKRGKPYSVEEVGRNNIIKRIDQALTARPPDDPHIGQLLVDCRTALLQHKGLPREVERLKALHRRAYKITLDALRIDA